RGEGGVDEWLARTRGGCLRRARLNRGKMKFVPKFKVKYSDWKGEPNLLWDRDQKIDNGIAFLPLYMASLL
ncbi:MAG: hypothetical protein IJG13_17110, partial [Kiritimatiellae bacterium]|nr:hypothetical protein [Kiritimatiellia bacterium]